jgi:hypothetical protein
VYVKATDLDSTILRFFKNIIVVFRYAVGITSAYPAMVSPRQHQLFARCVVSYEKTLDPQQLKSWLLAAGKRDAAAFRSL